MFVNAKARLPKDLTSVKHDYEVYREEVVTVEPYVVKY